MALKFLLLHQSREIAINTFIKKGTSAKNAFLFLKKEIDSLPAGNNEKNILRQSKRYKILETTVRNISDAKIYYQDNFLNQPLDIRPNTLGCLICEDSHYLFFIPMRKKNHVKV